MVGVADVRTQAECVRALKGLALPRASHSGDIALSGSRRLRSSLAALSVRRARFCHSSQKSYTRRPSVRQHQKNKATPKKRLQFSTRAKRLLEEYMIDSTVEKPSDAASTSTRLV